MGSGPFDGTRKAFVEPGVARGVGNKLAESIFVGAPVGLGGGGMADTRCVLLAAGKEGTASVDLAATACSSCGPAPSLSEKVGMFRFASLESALGIVSTSGWPFVIIFVSGFLNFPFPA